MRSLGREELKELLIKGWMTHDGMWFLHCLKECGMEKTNRINRAAIRSMAEVETKRVLQAFGLEKVESLADLREFVEAMFQVAKAEFMKFSHVFIAPDVLRVTMESCFAYEGMLRMGAAAEYQCGIFDRIEAWFRTLGLDYSLEPRVDGCLMHQAGACSREFKFNLE